MLGSINHLLFVCTNIDLQNDNERQTGFVDDTRFFFFCKIEICALESCVLCSFPSEAHAYPPWVACENFVPFLYDASVRAFVDGVGHYGDVIVFQGNVVWVRVLQQLPVFVPAETEGRRCSSVVTAAIGQVMTRHMNLLYIASLWCDFLPTAKS